MSPPLSPCSRESCKVALFQQAQSAQKLVIRSRPRFECASTRETIQRIEAVHLVAAPPSHQSVYSAAFMSLIPRCNPNGRTTAPPRGTGGGNETQIHHGRHCFITPSRGHCLSAAGTRKRKTATGRAEAG